LCDVQHIKQVPGGKTDVKDCEWLAELSDRTEALVASEPLQERLQEITDADRPGDALQAWAENRPAVTKLLVDLDG